MPDYIMDVPPDPGTLTDPHAVRWEVKPQQQASTREPTYTKWHGTDDGRWTWCARLIRPSFPETDGDLAKVDCRQCLTRKGH